MYYVGYTYIYNGRIIEYLSLPCRCCCTFELVPIDRCKTCCILGPRLLNNLGGKPLASNKACSLLTSGSSDSLSLFELNAAAAPSGLLESVKQGKINK